MDGHIISPLKEKEREEEFGLIDRVMRGARAGKRAALDVGEQMVWVCILHLLSLISMQVLINGISSLGFMTRF